MFVSRSPAHVGQAQAPQGKRTCISYRILLLLLYFRLLTGLKEIKLHERKTVSSQADAANPLGYEKEGKLLVGFAIPCIISMLVTSLYNIVDQIFIGQGVGLLGNAATNIAFPLSIACTAIALLLGIGSATNFSLQLGAGNEKRSAEYAGNGLCLMALFGTVLMAVTLLF